MVDKKEKRLFRFRLLAQTGNSRSSIPLLALYQVKLPKSITRMKFPKKIFRKFNAGLIEFPIPPTSIP